MPNQSFKRRDFIKQTALAAGAVGICSTAVASNTAEGETQFASKKKLSFNKNGKFKIVQFTDIHAVHKPGETDHSYAIMNKILDIEKPDFVMYTGDVVTDENPESLWKKVTEISHSRNIPFAVVFGNHDSEKDLTRDKVYDIVVRLDGCLNTPKKESIEEVFGYTNQVIPVYKSSNPNEKAYLFYLLDSNAVNNIVDSPRREDWVRSNQIRWYVNQSKKFTRENNGKPYPALAFFHIPLIEYAEVYKSGRSKKFGWRIENECCPPVNSGLFTAFLECKDVKAMFVGHDHDNDYVVYDQGIAMAYGRFSGGLNTYHMVCRGARVIELTEGAESFETWTRLETGRFLNRITIPESFISDNPQYKAKP